jgi:hypothetical protein
MRFRCSRRAAYGARPSRARERIGEGGRELVEEPAQVVRPVAPQARVGPAARDFVTFAGGAAAMEASVRAAAALPSDAGPEATVALAAGNGIGATRRPIRRGSAGARGARGAHPRG